MACRQSHRVPGLGHHCSHTCALFACQTPSHNATAVSAHASHPTLIVVPRPDVPPSRRRVGRRLLDQLLHVLFRPVLSAAPPPRPCAPLTALS
eukprot:2947291-Prymnesium_polylepis.1